MAVVAERTTVESQYENFDTRFGGNLDKLDTMNFAEMIELVQKMVLLNLHFSAKFLRELAQDAKAETKVRVQDYVDGTNNLGRAACWIVAGIVTSAGGVAGLYGVASGTEALQNVGILTGNIAKLPETAATILNEQNQGAQFKRQNDVEMAKKKHEGLTSSKTENTRQRDEILRLMKEALAQQHQTKKGFTAVSG